MKALITTLALTTIACAVFVFVPSQSSFDDVDRAQAAEITGGACYYITASGCRKVINQDPDGTYRLMGPGCDDNAAGNKTNGVGGKYNWKGKGKWCSFWHTLSCGIVITNRPFCGAKVTCDEDDGDECVIAGSGSGTPKKL